MKKMNFSPKNASGIGLIEVLITTVVVAVGLMAIASLQGNLTSGSRDSKTRAEAKALAETKIEQLRDSIERTGYNALASSSTSDSIAGVTETFSRSWLVTDQTNPEQKQVSVTVCWADGCPNTNNPENQVVVQSTIAFDNVGNSALAAYGAGTAGAGMGSPSTNAESSDEITKTITLPPSDTPYTPDTIYTDPDTDKIYIVQNTGTIAVEAFVCSDLDLDPFENDLLTRRIDFDGVEGDEAIELYEKQTISGEDYCIPRLRYNGGVIIPIRGIVHSGATEGTGNNQTLLDVNLFTFNASETGAFCVFRPDPNAKSAPYACYVGGNCDFGPDGVAVNGMIPVTECPNPAKSADKVGPGGWRGQVGLLGVAGATTSSTDFKNVCFAEEIAGTPATLNTARNYYARAQRNGVDVNEGINKPYSCHDFLIINGKQTEAQVHSECVTQANAIAGLHLASKNIQRTISTGDNVFDPVVEETYCTPTSYTVTGTITNANNAPAVTTPSGTCSATATSYTCTITTTASSAIITGSYNNETVNCTVSPLSTVASNTCNLAFTFTSNPSYTINGTISGTAIAANAVVLSLSDGGSCTNYNNGTYTCNITTALSNVTLSASIMTGATVTPTSQTITLPGVSTSIGSPESPSFNASDVYTISGSIGIGIGGGNQVSDLSGVTAAVNTGAGSCTLTGTNADDTYDYYTCTVPAGANTLTIAISPWCSTGGGSKKYEMTDGNGTGTITTTGTGSWIKSYSNITGNITKNISINRSNTNC
ncbi:MAG: type IV pilus modification PilV family protein [Methylomicrobium sp.]